MTEVIHVDASEPERPIHRTPLWDPETGRFDGPRLHMAIVVRRWTTPEFARDAGINRCSIYNAINGRRLRDATALRIFETLATREPLALTG